MNAKELKSKVDELMKRWYPVQVHKIEEDDDDPYFLAFLVDFGHSACSAAGETFSEAIENLLRSRRFVFETYLKKGIEIPDPSGDPSEMVEMSEDKKGYERKTELIPFGGALPYYTAERKPSSFLSVPLRSVFSNEHLELMAYLVMKCLSDTGNKFRKITFEEFFHYAKENFDINVYSPSFKEDFNKVVVYCSSPEKAEKFSSYWKTPSFMDSGI